METSSPANSVASIPAKRPVSLGVIFLTLYIDLIGFSIIFPLGPDLLKYYLSIEGTSGIVGAILTQLQHLSHWLGNDSHLPEVLFGGLISSLFSILQFVFAPIWGGLSDRRGRRGILVFTVAGTAFSYLLWALSGSFWLFLISRLLAGLFGGNLSVASAAVADVTSREERSKAMGLVGAAFGLGLVTGPVIGAVASKTNLLAAHPHWANFGINPFSVPALIAFSLGLLNLVWITARFKETRPPAARLLPTERRTRNPLGAILGLKTPAVRSVNLVAFLYALAFVAMEATLTFLAADRFNYTSWENGKLMGFLGICSVITQGGIVRRLPARFRETQILGAGLLFSAAGFVLIGYSLHEWVLYLGVAFLSLGGGLVNPSSTGLISLYASNEDQGRVLGIYRSLGALARAVTPILAGIIFWSNREHGAHVLYIIATVSVVAAWWLSRKLPQPVK